MDYQKLLRSFLLGLSGVVGTYVVQFLSAADFGPLWTPLIAAGLPVAVNAVRQWLASRQKRSSPPAPPPDLTGIAGADLLATPPKSPSGDFFAGLLLAPLLLVPTLAQADAPRAIINGPNTGVPGEILILDASPSEGEPTHFTWKISPELKGRKQLDVKDNGRRVQVASFGGQYVVMLSISNADGNDVLTWPIAIPGAPPCPPPEPQPVTPTPVPEPQPPPQPTPPAPQPVTPTPPAPQPDPVTPQPPPSPGRFGIAPRVRAAVLGVSSPTRAAEVARLRARLTELRSQGAAGSLTAQQFLDALVAELKSLPDSWQVVKTLAALGIRVLVAGGQLKTVQDFVDLAAEILDALAGL